MALNMDALRQKKEKRSGGFGWKPKAGENTIRVLPPSQEYFEGDVDDFAIEYQVHFLKQEGYDTVVSRCLRDKGEYCPVCEAAAKFKDSKDAELQAFAKDIRRGEQHAMNILDLDREGGGVQGYVCGYNVYNAILEFAANPKWGDLLSPEEGRDIVLKLTPGSEARSGYNTYAVSPDPEKTDVTEILEEECEDWQADLDELPSLVTGYLGENELVAILDRMGFPVQKAEKVEKEDGGSTARSRRRARKVEKEPEDEYEAEDEGDEDDEEDAQDPEGEPEDDEEDDKEDEDEDDKEEEKPAPRKRPTRKRNPSTAGPRTARSRRPAASRTARSASGGSKAKAGDEKKKAPTTRQRRTRKKKTDDAG